nr:hypothetical protein [Tanacetum cinerariifolium]
IAHVANQLALVAQQQQVYHPQTHPTHYNQNSSTRSQQAVTRNRGKAIVNSPRPIYDQEPSMVNYDDDDETSKDKEIDKVMALISLSFKKIYKPTNNNLRTSSNTSRANQDNSPRIHRNAGYEHQRLGNVAGARETVEQKVQNDDHYDVFSIECQHPEQSKSVHKTYLIEQDAHNVIIDSVDMNYDSDQIDQNDEDADLAKEQLKRRDSIEYASEMELECAKHALNPIFRCGPIWGCYIDKLMALISLSFKKIYKPSNNNPRTSSNTSRANQDNSPRINRGTGYENQRIGNVVGARETVGSSVVQKFGIQCYNCKEFGHVAKECQKPKRAKDAAYNREKMLLYQELEAHYMYMAQLQDVSPDAADSGPIFDDEPVQKVSNDDHYNVFAMESVHPVQSKSVHDTYPIKQDAQNVIIDSLDINYDREEIDQTDDDNDLVKERELLASLIEKLKYEIDESKNRNKILETSNKVLIENLKGDYKKFEAELARRNNKEYASHMELECEK